MVIQTLKENENRFSYKIFHPPNHTVKLSVNLVSNQQLCFKIIPLYQSNYISTKKGERNNLASASRCRHTQILNQFFSKPIFFFPFVDQQPKAQEKPWIHHSLIKKSWVFLSLFFFPILFLLEIYNLLIGLVSNIVTRTPLIRKDKNIVDRIFV